MKNTCRALAFVFFSAALLPAHAQDADLAAAREANNKRDYAAAVKLLQPLVEQRNTKAMSMMGKMRLAGQGVVKDEGAAAALFRSGADAGDPEAMYLLGRQMYAGNGLPKDETGAVAMYLKSAELGNAEGQLWYAMSLYRGHGGLTQDKAAALPWFRRAAEQGQAGAQNWIGDFYNAGELIEKNPYEAINWYRKSALQLDPFGQRNLGIAYARGNGVARDDAEAFKWLLSAAYLRDTNAQEWVGSFYQRGRGVAPDPVTAYMWFSLGYAHDPKNEAVRTELERIASKFSPAQMSEAQARIRQWPVAADMAKALMATEAYKSAALPATIGTVVARPAPPPTKPAAGGLVSGSGFVVGTGPNFVVSNHHVVKDCKSIKVMPFDLPAVLRAKDERNDLALLSVANLPAPALKLRTGRSIRPGDDLITLGYPLSGLLAAGASVNTGTLTNLGGMNNDTSLFQISVPIQPGNSGGPVLDNHGQVVGVVVSQLNAVKFAQATGTVPQNINFAINTATLSSFLEASNVDFGLSHLQEDAKAKRLGAADVGSLARRSTVRVECISN
jgi:TPR repeat protein